MLGPELYTNDTTGNNKKPRCNLKPCGACSVVNEAGINQMTHFLMSSFKMH